MCGTVKNQACKPDGEKEKQRCGKRPGSEILKDHNFSDNLFWIGYGSRMIIQIPLGLEVPDSQHDLKYRNDY